MDDLKLYVNLEVWSHNLQGAVTKFNKFIQMYFRIGKCKLIKYETGVLMKTKGFTVKYDEMIKDLSASRTLGTRYQLQ